LDAIGVIPLLIFAGVRGAFASLENEERFPSRSIFDHAKSPVENAITFGRVDPAGAAIGEDPVMAPPRRPPKQAEFAGKPADHHVACPIESNPHARWNFDAFRARQRVPKTGRSWLPGKIQAPTAIPRDSERNLARSCAFSRVFAPDEAHGSSGRWAFSFVAAAGPIEDLDIDQDDPPSIKMIAFMDPMEDSVEPGRIGTAGPLPAVHSRHHDDGRNASDGRGSRTQKVGKNPRG